MSFQYTSRNRFNEPARRHAAASPARRDSHRKQALAAAGGGGLPLYLQIDLGLHNSPPAAGRGSRSEPLIAGRRASHAASAMSTDAYYRSPVNDTNPVLVWTDGTRLFFAPSEGQVTSGRAITTPEPTFSPPPGYVAEELHWDRVAGLATGGGSLVIVARKSGAPDIEVAISNTLQQSYSFIGGLGLTSGVNAMVSREGAEFARVDDSTVPLDYSGAGAAGDIHAATFADGFFRYRAPGGSHDLYVAQGADPVAHLVERATGTFTRTFASGTIATVTPEANGLVHLELTTGGSAAPARSTISIDLRASPPTLTTATGHTTAESGYSAARSRLTGLGVLLHENGLRMRVVELEAIEQALALGSHRGLNALIEFRRREGLSSSDPILEVTKSIGPDSAYGLAHAGSGIPTLDIHEPFSETATAREAAVRHEMTHVIMGAIEAVNRAALTAQQRADLEGAMRYEANRARRKAGEGLLRAGEYGAGDRVPPAGARSDWRDRVGSDPRLASLWVELLRRYSFIPDPEGTRELRGASLVDESRYSGVTERAGHPADSVDEFVASFVTSATLFRAQLVAAVLGAETAGNGRGGGGGSYLRGLYRRAWTLIDATYVPLGPNPF